MAVQGTVSRKMSKKTFPADLLSPSEWKVFYVLSTRREPLSTKETMVELTRIDPESSWVFNTVQTLLKRLVDKGFLTREEVYDSNSSRAMPVYGLAVPYEEALRLHLLRFLDQFALAGQRDIELIERLLHVYAAQRS